MSFCHVTFSRPLIGQKRAWYIVEEVIEVDELDKGNISAALCLIFIHSLHNSADNLVILHYSSIITLIFFLSIAYSG